MKTIKIGGSLFHSDSSRMRKGVKINYVDLDYERYLERCQDKRANCHRDVQAGASNSRVHLKAA